MASVALLIQFNPVKRHTHINLLARPPACKLRIQFSRRNIKQKLLAVKCIQNRHPPLSSFSVDDDDVQEVYKNPRLDAAKKLKSFRLFDLKSYTVCTGCAVMYPAHMTFAASLVSRVITYLLFLAGVVSLLYVLAGYADYVPWMIHEHTTSVIKLQVGLLGMGSSLVQKKLNRITEVVDASTRKGLNYVSTEVSMALLRHIDYCISGSVDVKMSDAEWEKRFKLLSIEERGKLNVKSIWTPSSSGRSFSGSSSEDIVVTILIAVKGLHKLPSISKTTDLKEALQKVASILAKNTLAVEVFWTPQNENDMLLEQRLLKDYPLLKRL